MLDHDACSVRTYEWPSGSLSAGRLREFRRGDEIAFTRADGTSVRFAVERTEQYGKQRFPTDAVYYPTNVIVFATLEP